METFIIIAIIIIYLILIAWSWKNLGNLEKSKKIIYIVIGLIATYIFTYIIILISRGNIEYPNDEIKQVMQNTLTILFAGINGSILMPYVAKTVDKINEEEIDKKGLKKKFIIFIILVVAILIFEIGYVGSTQEGILQILDARSAI